jgi:SAM-dependent methyltransferase
MKKEMNKRVLAEKKFHNQRFNDENENHKKRSRYYLALENWYKDYSDLILNFNGKKILEIGTGVESISMDNMSNSFEIYSIDISEEAIKMMRENEKLKNIDFSVQDVHSMQFESNYFDLIVGRGILHHLDLPIACKEIKRVLSKNGAVLFGEPLGSNVFINIYRYLTPSIRTDDERPLSKGDMDKLKSVFGEVNVKYYGFLTLIFSIFWLKSPNFIHKLDNYLLNTMKLGKYIAWSCLISTLNNR